MASYNKFNDFVEQLSLGTHVFNTHTFKVLLTNTAPSAANAVKTDLTEISPGNGYSAGGATATATMAEAAGVATYTGTKVVFTASGGTIGPFRYSVLYNDSAASDNLVAWWDYGSAITLNDGETFSVKFNGSDTTGTIATVT